MAREVARHSRQTGLGKLALPNCQRCNPIRNRRDSRPTISSIALWQDLAPVGPAYCELVELEQVTSAEIAARIQTEVSGEDRKQWQKGTPAEWALESLAVVRTQVCRLPASGEITTSYTEAARAVIRTRLAQSGARLAWMLNETLR